MNYIRTGPKIYDKSTLLHLVKWIDILGSLVNLTFRFNMDLRYSRAEALAASTGSSILLSSSSQPVLSILNFGEGGGRSEWLVTEVMGKAVEVSSSGYRGGGGGGRNEWCCWKGKAVEVSGAGTTNSTTHLCNMYERYINPFWGP